MVEFWLRRVTMKVKIFLSNLVIATGGSEQIEFEDMINNWLKENPNIEIIDIRFSVGMRDNSTQDELTQFDFQNATASCLILYKEAPASHESQWSGA